MADPTNLGGALDTSHVLERGFLELLADTDDVVPNVDLKSEKAKKIKEKRFEIFQEAIELLYESYKDIHRVSEVGYRFVSPRSKTLELYISIIQYPDLPETTFPLFNASGITNPLVFTSSHLPGKQISLNITVDIQTQLVSRKITTDCLSVEQKTILDHLNNPQPPYRAGHALYIRNKEGRQIGTGTIGGWVKFREKQLPVILSNLHVLNLPGKSIFSVDTGYPSRHMEPATFERVETSNFITPGKDFALAIPVQQSYIPQEVLQGIGFPMAYLPLRRNILIHNKAEARLGDRVFKVGSTTGYTEGTVNCCFIRMGKVDAISIYPARYQKTPSFKVYSDRYMSAPGDSGSLIIKITEHEKDGKSRRIVGLLSGGGDNNPNLCNFDQSAECIHIDYVCSELKIDVY